MTDLRIDTDGSRTTTRQCVVCGDGLNDAQFRLDGELRDLQLDGLGAPVCWDLAAAATQLWTAGVFLQLVVDRVELADRYGGTALLDQATIDRLRLEAGERVRVVANACTIGEAYASSLGDLGGTYGAETRSPYLFADATSTERGRDLVLRALLDTSSGAQIRADEFEIVEMNDGRYLVVLPGVTDLTHPDLGLSDTNRTVRDVDQYAYPSSRSSRVTDNEYAAMVWAALTVRGVPRGSELVIVGHSFGADTALDLAADPNFNGPDGYQVTHVVAAAYHSGPQLPDVQPGTRVLVLQNDKDVAVIGEAIGGAHVTDLLEAERGYLDHLVHGDLIGAASDYVDATVSVGGMAIDVGGHVLDHSDDVADVMIGVGTFDIGRAVDGSYDFVTLEPGVTTPRDGQVVAVFEGGFEGAGHHQHNYMEYVRTVDDPDVLGFLASLGSSSQATTGTAYAIDVSVP